jgi:cytochrome b6-f complex iron-sulfur subunit
MAKRPSVKEILEAARKGGAAKPADESAPAVAETAPVEDVGEVALAAEPAGAPAPPANVPTAASLGRPLTLKEKLAAARAGGAPPAAAATAPAPAKKAAPAPAAVPAESAEEVKAVPPAAKPLCRPMTLQEKLAAARGTAADAGSAAPAPGPKSAAPKPAAAKAEQARTLPPLGEITDPKDLAEAARQASAKKAKEIAAKAAAAAPPKAAAKSGPAKPQTVPPRPTRELAGTAAATEGRVNRRGFFLGSVFVTWAVAWIVVAWATFTAALSAMTLMSVRFMFPNVLAEPPSTIKVGLPTNYEPDEVSERFKAEWGFWIVRSTRYNGQDVIYALKSVCTHLGCPPNWLAAEQKFKCPCHGSGFYISGINFEGPAPRPLERFKVALADDGQIQVDKSQIFQQELGQWSDPDSFIPA